MDPRDAAIHILVDHCEDLERQLQRYRDIHDAQFVCEGGKFYLSVNGSRWLIGGSTLVVWKDRNPCADAHIPVIARNSSVILTEIGYTGDRIYSCELRLSAPEDNTSEVIYPSQTEDGIFYWLDGCNTRVLHHDNMRKLIQDFAKYYPPSIIVYD